MVILLTGALIHVVEPAHHMKEQRPREDQTVDAIEQPAMTGNERSHVLQPDIPFDHADREISQLSTNADNQSGQHELQGSELRKAEPEQPWQYQRERHRSESAPPRLVRTDFFAQP